MDSLKTFKKVLLSFLGILSGYLLIPLVGLGVILITNSSKGWGVTDKDGIMFIPFGIILLLCAITILVLYLLGFRMKKDKKFSTYIKRRITNVCFLLGIVAYLITAWCF